MAKKGTYTKVMAAHEVRMWIGQVIIPGAVATGIISQTDLGKQIGYKLKSAGNKIKNIFTKKK